MPCNYICFLLDKKTLDIGCSQNQRGELECLCRERSNDCPFCVSGGQLQPICRKNIINDKFNSYVVVQCFYQYGLIHKKKSARRSASALSLTPAPVVNSARRAIGASRLGDPKQPSAFLAPATTTPISAILIQVGGLSDHVQITP